MAFTIRARWDRLTGLDFLPEPGKNGSIALKVQPTKTAFQRLARDYNVVPLYTRIVADYESPLSIFSKIREGNYSFLFESVEGGEKWGRYSFMGRAVRRVIRTDGRRVEEIVPGAPERTRRLETDNPLHYYRDAMREWRAPDLPEIPRFCGGLVGYIGYDMVRYMERIPDANPNDLGVPESVMMLADDLVVYDNVTHTVTLIANVFLKEGSDEAAAYADGRERLKDLARKVRGPLKRPKTRKIAKAPLEPTSNFSPEDFKDAVLKCKDYIHKGDAFQLVLSQRFGFEIEDLEPFNLYRALRLLNPSPYMFFLDLDGFQLVGSSPEVLVRLEHDRVTVRPIAGTRHRGENETEDLALEKELLADPKERAEHIMLVDLGRNDIGRVSRVGSVHVDELMVVERYSHVMHIVSNVIGELQEGKDAFDVLSATFPAGTLSGAPKIRAMEIIDELEPTRRGPYGGSVGYFSLQGSMDMCIAIRTFLVQGKALTVQAGAGIVADSDPDFEFEETRNKARALLRALELLQKGF